VKAEVTIEIDGVAAAFSGGVDGEGGAECAVVRIAEGQDEVEAIGTAAEENNYERLAFGGGLLGQHKPCMCCCLKG